MSHWGSPNILHYKEKYLSGHCRYFTKTVNIIDMCVLSGSFVSNSLLPHGLQHARLPCPSPTPRLTQTHVHQVDDAIQPSHPLSSPSPPALNLSQQGLRRTNKFHCLYSIICLRLQPQWGSILGLERSPGRGHGNSLQYSCLENPMDRGAWQATVHGVAKSWNHKQSDMTERLN